MRRFQTLGLLAVVSIALGILRGDDAEQVSVKLPFDAHQAKGRPGGGLPTILYHSGPILAGKVPIYIIYYGSVPLGTQGIVNNFFVNLNGSAQYAVNATYFDTNNFVSSSLDSPVMYVDSSSQGKSLNSNSIPKIIHAAIAANGLPADSTGVYFVITAPEIKVAGFCSSFCAYHTRTTINGTDIKYALVPDPGQACTGCNGNFAKFGTTATPNSDPGADEMTDSIIHELSETVTDPDLNAWYTSTGEENGDLCNYNYGTTTILPSGAHYNVTLNGTHYLIQRIWENASPGFCAP